MDAGVQDKFLTLNPRPLNSRCRLGLGLSVEGFGLLRLAGFVLGEGGV